VDIRSNIIDGGYDDTRPDTPSRVLSLRPKTILLGESITKSLTAPAKD
jgi:hypothetical protein